MPTVVQYVQREIRLGGDYEDRDWKELTQQLELNWDIHWSMSINNRIYFLLGKEIEK